MPCVFVRTTGCNLRCTWCDTEYAFHDGQEFSLETIIERVESYNCDLVEITGGEPLLQKQVPELAERLLTGHTVLVETSGERDISVLDPRVIRIMDLKCPGSGESERNRWQNIPHLTQRDEVKFVIKDRSDYIWAREAIQKHRLQERVQLLFSPVFDEVEPRALVDWILEDGLKARFQLQLHKLVWPPETKGV